MFFYNIFSILLTNRKQCCIIYKVNNFGFDRAKDTRVTDLQRAAVWCKAVAVRNIELSLEPSTERLLRQVGRTGFSRYRDSIYTYAKSGLIVKSTRVVPRKCNFVSVV